MHYHSLYYIMHYCYLRGEWWELIPGEICSPHNCGKPISSEFNGTEGLEIAAEKLNLGQALGNGPL